MTSHYHAPAKPLLVILGSTGTGKSELAVELARRFRGEIINADAMQLYDGLPLITNKITPDEQRGIPHHLLGGISLDEIPWDVDKFKSHAMDTIDQVRGRGNLPILVGGTHYYVDSILFQDILLDSVQTDESHSHPILEEPTEVLLEELRKVDPVMAERWHPNDRRKIRRSLEIFLSSGRRASELYAEQEQRKAAAGRQHADGERDTSSTPWENLLFWVFSEREVLCERLDRRVDKMLDGGLLEEVRELYEFKNRRTAEGHAPDPSKGIWQSIGYKQFEAYLAAVDKGSEDEKTLEALKKQALEEMKTATRRYANYQTRWTRLKQVPRLREQGGDQAMSNLYVLDSTDASPAAFAANVIEPAASITTQFLRGDDDGRPKPEEVSALAREVLEKATAEIAKETPCHRTCELCGTTILTEEKWERHVKGAQHRRVARRRKRLAVVPVEGDGDGQRGENGKSKAMGNKKGKGKGKDEGESSDDSVPDLGSLF